MMDHVKPSLLLCTFVIFFSVTAAVAAMQNGPEGDGNPIVNPGLEQLVDGDPVGWGRYSPNGHNEASTVSPDARTGDAALLIDVDQARLLRPDLSTIRQAWNQRLSWDADGWAEPGATYTVSFYYKTEGDPKLRFGLERRRYEDAEKKEGVRTHNQYTDFPPVENWTYAEVEFEWPHPDTHTDFGVLIQFFTQNGANGKIWIDDVEISEVDLGVIGANGTDRPSGIFYISPDGDDRDSGTFEAPWRTLGHVSRQAIAGDTIVFFPGDYSGVLRPVRSGTADAPITFKSMERRTARLVGQSGAEHAVQLSRVEHILVEGFHIKPQSSQGRWMLVDGSKYIRIEDVFMEDAHGGMPFHITHSEHIYMRDSVLRKYTSGNMARVGDSNYLLFEGNSISRAGHSPFQFYPDSSSQYVVVRGNVFHAAWGRNFEFFGTRDILFEHNIITNAFDSGRSASTNAKFATDHGIFRFNRIFRNWGGAIHLYPFRDVWLSNIRLYHNVFDDNNEYGIATSNSPGQMRHVQFLNNVFSRNDKHGSEHQVSFSSIGNPDTNDQGEPIPRVSFLNNVVAANRKEHERVIGFGGQSVDVQTVQNDLWTTISLSNKSVSFSQNINVSPQFVDAAIYNHAPAPGSPLINSGDFLTTAVGTGEGHIIPVEDAAYFYDGFGIQGEQGDLIAIGSPDQIARIIKVDLDKNQLILDRTVQWDNGAPVSFPWSGSAPDIGVYEIGTDARPSVQVVASPFVTRPNEEVNLSVSLFGIDDPDEIRWQLGDGTVAFGEEFTHRYAEPYDYPIRVRVTTKSGEVYRGAGYVVIDRERPIDAPFIHTTFDSNDEDWWWLWKTYRPMPADWSRDLDAGTGNGVLRVSDPGGGALSAKIAPADWDIDLYPWIYARYRILPDTPIGLYIEGFRGIGGGGRRTWLAATEKNRDIGSNHLTHYELIDDGEWHTLLLDARIIRDQHPDVNVLQRLGLESRSNSKKGDTYWLDEFAILPAEALNVTFWKVKLSDMQRGHIDVVSPREGAAVHGDMIIATVLTAYDNGSGDDSTFEIERIDFEIDRERWLMPEGFGSSPDLRIDTNNLSEGPHQLVISLTDQTGRTIKRDVSFNVRNWRVIKDELKPPVETSFFGTILTTDHSMTSAESDGWAYASDLDEPDFIHMTGKVKVADGEAFLIWDSPGLRSFEIVVRSKSSDVNSIIETFVDRGDGVWVELPYTVRSARTTDGMTEGWVKHIIQGSDHDDAESFKLLIGSKALGKTFTVEQVTLEVRSR